MIGPGLSIAGMQRSSFNISSTQPNMWMDPSSGLGTVGSRLFTLASSQYFTLGTKPNPGTSNFWVSFWIKPAAVAAANYGILYTGGEASDVSGIWLYQYEDDIKVSFNTVDGGAPLTTTFTDVGLAVGVWRHVVLLVNRTAGTITLRSNNVLSATSLNIAAKTAACTPNSAAASWIGAIPTPADYYDGSLSRLAYGAGTLPTADEIAELYNLGNGKYYAELSAGLQAKVTYHWNLNEASGNAMDAKGSNTGTASASAPTAGAGPREAQASDLVGGYHGTLTNMDTVNAWSTDTPDGSFTTTKVDSVGTAHGTMTGFADVDAAHVDGPDGAWGPYVPNDGTDGATSDGWLQSSVKDSRSASVPSSLNVRAWDEAYSEPTATGSRWLDGVDQRFSMATNPAYGTDNFTLSAWVYLTDLGSYRYFIGTGGTTAGNKGASLLSRTDNRFAFELSDGVARSEAVSPAGVTIETYKWTHLIGVCDRVGGFIHLYVNGALVTSTAITQAQSATPTSTYKCIGTFETGAGIYFVKGAMSRVHIALGSAYTAADIAEAYNGGKGKAFTDYSAGLAAKVTYAWELNEATAATATCIKGSNDATQLGTDAAIKTAASPYLPAYDGTLTGFTTSPRSSSDVPTVLAGKCKSIRFGVNKYATTGVKTVSGMGGRSISFWVKRDGNPGASEYLLSDAGNATTYGLAVMLANTGRLYCYLQKNISGQNVFVLDPTTVVTDNLWHHVVFTWDGTTDANKAIAYIDNVVRDTATANLTSQGALSSYNLQISGSGGTTACADCSICRPQIFAGRALTAQEVTDLYNGLDVLPGLTAEWRFNESDTITVPFTASLECDGANTKVDCGTDSIGTGAVTVSAWVNVDAAGEGNYGSIVNNGKTLFRTVTGWSLNVSSDGGTVDSTTTVLPAVPASQWIHACMTRTAAGHIQVFINGNRTTLTKIYSLNGGAVGAATSNLLIGNNAASDRTFDGRIGLVQVHTGVLTQAQIRQLAQGQTVGSPKGSWKFDEPLDLPYLNGCRAIRRSGDTAIIEHTDIGPLTNATWMAWVWCEEDSETDFFRGSNVTRMEYSGSSSIRVYSDAGWHTSATGAFVKGAWHHVAMVFTGGATIAAYVNGNEAIAAYATAHANVTINQILYAETDGIRIADARIYSSALTTAQIRSLITGTDFRTGISAQWKFGETPRSIPSCAGGYSLAFDGSDDTVVIGNVGNVTSIEFYVKSLVANQELMTLAASTATAITVVAGTLTFGASLTVSAITVDDVTKTAAAAGALINDGAWHKVSLTMTSIAASNLKLATDSSAFGNVRLDYVSINGGTSVWSMDDGPQYGEPSNGDPISVWESRDGDGYQFTQATAASRPTYVQVGQNNLPGLGFNGSSQHLKAVTQILRSGEGTVVVVGKTLSNAAAQAILNSADEGTAATYYAGVGLNGSGYLNAVQKNNDTATDVYGSTLTGTSAVRILSVRSDGTAYRSRVDGAAQTLTGTNNGDWMADTLNLDNTAIGAQVSSSVASYFSGVLYEILAYDRCLTDAELTKVERKLASKYGLTLA